MINMEEGNQSRKRRVFRWSGAARETARAYLHASKRSEECRRGAPTDLKSLIARLVEVSGNPRDACWRFVRQFGIREKQSYRTWTNKEQQKLLDLIVTHPLHEVTLLLRRSPASIHSMLRRLGANARIGQDWFTKYTLAEALHVRAEEVQKWIDRGWLKCRIVQTGTLKKEIIDAADFCEFCKRYRTEIIGRRLNSDRLSFVQTFVFPPSHMELLPVREAKKEQAEYEAQMRKEAEWAEHEEKDKGFSISA
jgi:hypothetical protein